MPPGPGIPAGLVVPAGELTEQFSRAGGPGGQGVNTTDSRVQLSLDLATTSALTDRQRERAARLSTRLVGTTLTVDASEHRAQRRNRSAARERMAALLREALAPPPRLVGPRNRPEGRNGGGWPQRPGGARSSVAGPGPRVMTDVMSSMFRPG